MIPKEVFHYTTTKIALEKILFEKQLRIGQLKFTNDPKESKEHLFDSFQNAPWDISALIKRLKEIATPIKLNEWRVLCFSKNHPDLESEKVPIYENPLLSGGYRPRMWAHYGENHKGVCIKFNGIKLDEQIKKSFLGEQCKVFCGNVEYDDKWCIEGTNEFINFNDISELNDIEFAEWLRQEYFSKHYKKIFLTKSKDWESEYEFRWLVHSEKGAPEFIPIRDIVEEVLVGCDFDEANYPSLFKFCKDLGIPAYKVLWDNGNPGRYRVPRP